MKKTIACLAMIAGAVSGVTANAADAKKDTKIKGEERAPASTGHTFAGCMPSYSIYGGNEAYKNSCMVPLQTFQVPAGGFTQPGSTTPALGCDEKHNLVVSANPINFRCLPPGAVEL
jgi:hypothetical protein